MNDELERLRKEAARYRDLLWAMMETSYEQPIGAWYEKINTVLRDEAEAAAHGSERFRDVEHMVGASTEELHRQMDDALACGWQPAPASENAPLNPLGGSSYPEGGGHIPSNVYPSDEASAPLPPAVAQEEIYNREIACGREKLADAIRVLREHKP